MKIFLPYNVYEGALDRLRYLFSEFQHVYVSFSGGKDSTVVLELALSVARELDRLPLNVLFIDQEAEWDVVIRYMRRTMSRKEINPIWLQIPIQLFNGTSTYDPWLYCWKDEDEEKWIRPKEPNSVHENIYDQPRFKELFGRYVDYHHPNESVAQIGGVRCHESPARTIGLTCHATYKHLTWGSKNRNKKHRTFYPIYDWALTDVWKAIHDHEWDYCRLYDLMYQHGVPTDKMRVSNVHHETAIRALFFLQELEPKTWDRITARLSGISSAGQMQESFLLPPKELPFMFKDWKEYRGHLLDHLITDPDAQKKMRRQIEQFDERYIDEVQDKLVQVGIQAILTNDWHLTKLITWNAGNMRFLKNAGKYGRPDGPEMRPK